MEIAEIDEPASSPQMQISNYGMNLETFDGELHITGASVAGNIEAHTVHTNLFSSVKYETKLPPKDVTPKRKRFQVIHPTKPFVGREDFLEDLRKAMQSDCQFAVIAATGGIGKTETARMYIQENDHAYDNVVWIDAEEVPSAKSQFLTLANEIGVETKSDKDDISFGRILVQIYAKLCRNGNTLLVVFDNAEITTEDDAQESTITPFLPRELNSYCVTPSILVTSRSQDWDTDNQTIINLDMWSLDECITFLRLKLKPADPDAPEFRASAEELSELFGRLPIALLAATAVILQESDKCKIIGLGEYGIQNLIHDYKTSKKKVLAKNPTKSTTNQTMLVLWNVTFSKVVNAEHGVLAINVLSAMAYMSPIGIPKALIRNIFKKESEHLADALILLRNYSYISDREDPSQHYTIHRVIQDVTIEHLETRDGPYQGVQDKELLRSDSSVLLHLCQQLISYIQSESDLQNVLSPDGRILENIVRVTQHISTRLEVPEFYRLTCGTANLLGKMKDHTQAHSLFMNLLKFNEESQGQDVAKITLEIGINLFNQGKFQESIDLLKQNLHMEVSQADKTTIKRGIALNLMAMRKLDEALKWQLEVLNESPEPKSALKTIADMTLRLLAKGDYTSALKVYEFLLGEQEKRFGSDYVENLRIKVQIGSLLLKLGRLEEAVALSAQLQEDCKYLIPTQENYYSATLLHSMILGKVGKLDESTNLLKGLLEVNEKVRTPNNLAILHIKGLIGNNLLLQKSEASLDEALKVFKMINLEMENIYDSTHPQVLIHRNNMAIVLLYKKEYDEALKVFLANFKLQKAVFGKNHPHTLVTKFHIGHIYISTRKYEKGTKLFLNILLSKQSDSQLNTVPSFVQVAQFYFKSIGQLCSSPEIASLTGDELRAKFINITGATVEECRRQPLESKEGLRFSLVRFAQDHVCEAARELFVRTSIESKGDLNPALLPFAPDNINPAVHDQSVRTLANVPSAPGVTPDPENNKKLKDFMEATACPSVDVAIKFLQESNWTVYIALAQWLRTPENPQIESNQDQELEIKISKLFYRHEMFERKFYEQCNTLGPTNPDTQATALSLCQIYFALGKYLESAQLALSTYNLRKQIPNAFVRPTYSDILPLYVQSVSQFIHSPLGDQAVEEKSLLGVFMEITSATDTEACSWLENSNWDLEGALIRFTGAYIDPQTRKVNIPIFDSDSHDLSIFSADLDRIAKEALFVANFQAETGVDVDVAETILKESNWNIAVALERFYYRSRDTVTASPSAPQVKSQHTLSLQSGSSAIKSANNKVTRTTWALTRLNAHMLPKLYQFLVGILNFEPFMRPIWPSFSPWPWCLGILKVPSPASINEPATSVESEPTTVIAIQCPDGPRLRGHFKESDRVNELYEFVNKERPDLAKVLYAITYRQNITLTNKEQTLKEANVLKSALQVKLIK